MSPDAKRSPEELAADMEAVVLGHHAKVDAQRRAEGLPLIDWEEWSREAHRRFVEDAAKKPERESIRLRFPNGDAMTLSLEPDGSMSPDVKEHIFDPFFTTKEVGKGMGLGLSISYGIIEKHNGNIDVISEPGKGTEFIISLPKSQSNLST